MSLRALSTAGNHGVSAAGRSAINVQSAACGPCDGMGFSLDRLGVGMVMLWIEKLDLGHPTGRSWVGRRAGGQDDRVTG